MQQLHLDEPGSARYGAMLLWMWCHTANPERAIDILPEAVERYNAPGSRLRLVISRMQIWCALPFREGRVLRFRRVPGEWQSSNLEWMEIHLECGAHAELADLLGLSTDRPPCTLWREGLEASDKKQFGKARALSEQAIAKGPHFWLGHALLGWSLIFTEERERAVEVLREAVRLRPNHYPSWLYLAGAHSRLDQLPEARAALERAHSLHPFWARADVDLLVWRTQGLREMFRWRKRRQCVRKQLEAQLVEILPHLEAGH
jgi:tetratricopeptide (TPR) repeat protein